MLHIVCAIQAARIVVIEKQLLQFSIDRPMAVPTSALHFACNELIASIVLWVCSCYNVEYNNAYSMVHILHSIALSKTSIVLQIKATLTIHVWLH